MGPDDSPGCYACVAAFGNSPAADPYPGVPLERSCHLVPQGRGPYRRWLAHGKPHLRSRYGRTIIVVYPKFAWRPFHIMSPEWMHLDILHRRQHCVWDWRRGRYAYIHFVRIRNYRRREPAYRLGRAVDRRGWYRADGGTRGRWVPRGKRGQSRMRPEWQWPVRGRPHGVAYDSFDCPNRREHSFAQRDGRYFVLTVADGQWRHSSV